MRASLRCPGDRVRDGPPIPDRVTVRPVGRAPLRGVSLAECPRVRRAISIGSPVPPEQQRVTPFSLAVPRGVLGTGTGDLLHSQRTVRGAHDSGGVYERRSTLHTFERITTPFAQALRGCYVLVHVTRVPGIRASHATTTCIGANDAPSGNDMRPARLSWRAPPLPYRPFRGVANTSCDPRRDDWFSRYSGVRTTCSGFV